VLAGRQVVQKAIAAGAIVSKRGNERNESTFQYLKASFPWGIVHTGNLREFPSTLSGAEEQVRYEGDNKEDAHRRTKESHVYRPFHRDVSQYGCLPIHLHVWNNSSHVPSVQNAQNGPGAACSARSTVQENSSRPKNRILNGCSRPEAVWTFRQGAVNKERGSRGLDRFLYVKWRQNMSML
jgi:hypothetical protein